MIANLLLVLLTASPESCRSAYEGLHYREAAAACAEAVKSAPSGERASLYRLLGLSLAALGDTEPARAAFSSLLAIDPQAQLAPELSPRLREPFEAAQRAGAAHAVRILARATRVELGVPLELRVELEDSPVHPVTSLRTSGSLGEAEFARASSPQRLVLGAPSNADHQLVKLAALDRFGGTLATTEVDIALARSRPALLSWKLWGAAALVAGAVATGTLLAARSSYQSARAEPIAERAHQSEQRGAVLSTVGYSALGLSAALAVGTGVLAWTEPGSAP